MMAWSTTNSVQKTFSALFIESGDSFAINDDCLAILEEILRNLSTDDCTTWSFKRAFGAGQNIRKSLIPLLIHIKDDSNVLNATKIIDTSIKILVNLTIPLEYLVSIEASSRTEVGKRTMFELSRLLSTGKEVFADSRSTKAVVDHMKNIVERSAPLTEQECDSVNDCLLLLRNVLHIPEGKAMSGAFSTTQNQILWNLFTQSVDKIIIYLISCPQKMYWSITMVQLIALMYKDQHEGTLQKLLNLWLEAYYSDSSEDNESNTSPPERGSDDSSPVVTSDPTSDSSDNGGNGVNEHNTGNNAVNVNSDWNITNTADIMRAVQNRNKSLITISRNGSTETEASISSGISSMSPNAESGSQSQASAPQSRKNSTGLSVRSEISDCGYGTQSGSQSQSSAPQSRKNSTGLSVRSEISDCGYITQVENQESISTSSNDDDQPCQKPVHQKPHTFQKTRYSSKSRVTSTLDKKELRRKKLVKRRKSNNINMKGLLHHSPTEDDITNILKEFTVDFLLKGYGNLVNDLHSQLLANVYVQIDTSHFFWLVTYFLKFAIQLELDPEHISPVLTYDILSYLIFQGVCTYEELEISCLVPDVDLRPCLRRLHLVVTAIREFLQGVEAYQKMIHLSDADRDHLTELRSQIEQMNDLKMLFILLLRQYNPSIQSRQYFQDLILTNHNFLLFLGKSKVVQSHTINLMEHMKHFASVEVMRQYGLLLEGFKENGEYVNNCIFTMMHHIGGDLQSVSTLFQPSILKTFSQIWETDYEICDDWSDLIEYVIHKFINTPNNHCGKTNSPVTFEQNDTRDNAEENDILSQSEYNLSEWTREEKDNLLKYYNENRESSDSIARITEKYEENGMRFKTHLSIIRELLDQSIISENEYNDLIKHHQDTDESEPSPEAEEVRKEFEQNFEPIEYLDSDIKVLKEYLVKENKGKHLIWLQHLLLETCYVKLVLSTPEDFKNNDRVMEPTVYYSAHLNLPVPVIPWTTEQSNILKHQPFVLLLHKLGIYLPADTGKIFVRIPNFWTADYIFSIAQQLAGIDTDKLKFDVNKLRIKNKCDSSGVKQSDTYSDTGKFSTIYLKPAPLIRYTPLPNSTEWFQNMLTTRIAPIIMDTLRIPSTNQLSIAIPDTQVVSCNLPPPELAIVAAAPGLFNESRPPPGDAGYPCVHEMDAILVDDLERNSNCDTASVASDLTRMCVSDEEDKVVLVIEKTRKKS